MARFHYFSDVGGEAVQLVSTDQMPRAEFYARWPGLKGGRRIDGYSMQVGRAVHGGPLLPVTRAIEMKARPRLHECNAKCLGGKANGACECSCGGRNHGRGMFTALLAA